MCLVIFKTIVSFMHMHLFTRFIQHQNICWGNRDFFFLLLPLFPLSFLQPFSSCSHDTLLLSSNLSLSLSLMCFLCEWKTEQSYVSAGHQTFTSCSALECKRGRDRKKKRHGKKKGEECLQRETKTDMERHKKTDKKKADSEEVTQRNKQTERVRLRKRHTETHKESVKDRDGQRKRQGNSWTAQTKESLSECQ